MCRRHNALTEARNVNDLAVPAGEPQVDGMTTPVLRNFSVGVVDRVREMSSMFVGVFCFSGSLSGVVGLRRFLWWLVGTHRLRRGLYLIGNPNPARPRRGTGWYWLKIVIPR